MYALACCVLQEVAASFHATMGPEEYLAHNEQLWDALHDMLAPQAPEPLRRLPYPFRTSMLALLSAELPHLVAPAAQATRLAPARAPVRSAHSMAEEAVAEVAPSPRAAARARALRRERRRHRAKRGALSRWKPWCCARRAPR